MCEEGDDGDEASSGGGRLADRASEWVLLHGNRVLVGAGIAVLFGGLFAATAALHAAPLTDPQPTFYLFGGLISGNRTLITVVVSINQLLLSRELSTPGELDSQIEGLVDYREDVERASGRLAPVEPQGFLRLLFDSTRREAQRLGGLAVPSVSPDHRARIDGVVEEITDHIDRVDSLLERSDADIFSVLSVTLTTNYARQIHRTREIRDDLGEELTDPLDEATERPIGALRDVDIARQYFSPSTSRTNSRNCRGCCCTPASRRRRRRASASSYLPARAGPPACRRGRRSTSWWAC